MRCSDCFAEMKMGPNGPYCKACGTALQALSEDGDLVMPDRPKRKRPLLKTVMFLASIALLGAAGYFAIERYGLELPEFEFASAKETAPTPVASIVLSDPSGIVQRETSVASTADTLQLIAAQGCQRASKTPSKIEWVTPRGDPLFSLSPQLPDNWQVQDVCPTRTNGAIASAVLSDGLAISEISPNGSIGWTRILPVDGADPSQVVTKVFGDQILVLSPTYDASLYSLTVYAFDGDQLWQRLVPNVAQGTIPLLATSPLGDLLIAHNVDDGLAAYTLRVIALTPQNTVTYSTDLPDRSLPVSHVSSDDLGRVLLLEGRSGISAQLLAATGEPLWRRWIDAQAMPIGAFYDGDQFLVSGVTGGIVSLWGVRGNGLFSSAIEIPVDSDVNKGALRGLNDVQASLEVSESDSTSHRLIMNLVRISEALVFDRNDMVAPASEPTGDAVLGDVESVEETSFERDEAVVDTEASAQQSEAMEAVPEAAVQVETASTAPQTEGDSVPQADAPTVQVEQTPSAAPDELNAEVPDAQPVEALCMFTCAADSDPDVTYPIMQSVPLLEGEGIESVGERLAGTHVRLCQLSDGQPVVESSPECTAR